MSEKLPCSKCGALILQATAERTGGLCMPCKQGNRENIERSKEYYKKLKEYDPTRELWKSLVHRVYHSPQGYEGLTDDEKLYYAVNVLDGEVYNGGMHQFFSNSSGRHYSDVLNGLLELKAFLSLDLLREAKDLLFGDAAVPDDHMERNRAMKDYPKEGYKDTPWCVRLEQIDGEYWKGPDNLAESIATFAESRGLLAPFKQEGEQFVDDNPS